MIYVTYLNRRYGWIVVLLGSSTEVRSRFSVSGGLDLFNHLYGDDVFADHGLLILGSVVRPGWSPSDGEPEAVLGTY